MKDTLTEAMDLEGLLEVLRGIADGTIRCIAIDTPIPSVFAHELINAMPYAFLDPEDAAARRTRAVIAGMRLGPARHRCPRVRAKHCGWYFLDCASPDCSIGAC